MSIVLLQPPPAFFGVTFSLFAVAGTVPLVHFVRETYRDGSTAQRLSSAVKRCVSIIYVANVLTALFGVFVWAENRQLLPCDVSLRIGIFLNVLGKRLTIIFLTLRAEEIVGGTGGETDTQYGPRFMRWLRRGLLSFFILEAVGYLLVTRTMPASTRGCTLVSSGASGAIPGMATLVELACFALNLFLFVHKVWQLYDSLKTSRGQTAIHMLGILQKNTFLTAVVVFSHVFLVVLILLFGMPSTFTLLSQTITVYSIHLMFDWNSKHYDALCGCSNKLINEDHIRAIATLHSSRHTLPSLRYKLRAGRIEQQLLSVSLGANHELMVPGGTLDNIRATPSFRLKTKKNVFAGIDDESYSDMHTEAP